MIEEDLYKKASDELSTNKRKSDIWARACALASDDHDEARYLYTNLRVEQMREELIASGIPLTDAQPARDTESESGVLILDDEHEAQGPVWQSAAASDMSKPAEDALAIDELLDLDEDETIDTSASVLANSDTLNTEQTGALSEQRSGAIYEAEPADNIIPSASTGLPEQQKAAALASDLERQVEAIETVRADYDDTDYLPSDDEAAPTLSELETGPGKPFLVFSRLGATKAIKQGVSWPALLFTLPWLLSRQLFGTAIIYVLLWCVAITGLLFTGFMWMDSGASATAAIRLWTLAFGLLALVGLFFVPFIYGNGWVANKLLRRGYELKSVVKAKNRNDAITRLIRYAS